MTPKKLLAVTLTIMAGLAACKNKQSVQTAKPPASASAAEMPAQPLSSINGSWVGVFEPDEEEIFVDKRGDSLPATPNKITLFISKLEDGNISGYSVCAGNERPFSGNYEDVNGKIKASLQEPGDNKFDGVFELQISKDDRTITGKWTPFNKALVGRHYTLQRKNFKYNPDYGRYPKTSTELLTSEDVNNMYKDELRYMRNEIYARHGYSFKLKDIRQEFDGQAWYMPISTDVRKKLTNIEIKNEKLIRNFEKYAEESYDDYGR
ncbi:MAG TPA: YARHG domain-containing protein [Niastella sp.]